MTRRFWPFVVLALAVPALAGDFGSPGRLDAVADELGLSEAQRERIREIRDDARAGAADRREALRAEREALRGLWTSDADDAKVLRQWEKVAALEDALRRERFEAMLDVRAELTVEQRAAVLERMTEARERRAGRRPEPPPL